MEPTPASKCKRLSEKNRSNRKRKGNASSSLPIFAVFAIIGVVFSGESRVAVGQLCGGDVGGLIRQCSTYVEKGKPMINPSQACCDLIKKVDILCACKHVTKELEELVDMKKVVHVVSYCGIPVPHGMKCGSKISLTLIELN
ncbi:uncharacterized protein Pyn_24591 [Prunus yedoensis var. nudiflora]|uniref:Bifunctional inhibitor/plant lipid transfer protein/seed storage helical domain-containing protein n=1 Tax=Prunus yedoensis var. nudiflora TaxID=2094558 RepID=A0A314Z764_PRUYE|nr:uncharacterized protein Pyn_24591 [Prunus yedoensis var. nudiflora]